MTANAVKRLTEEYLANFKKVVNAEANPTKYLAIDPGKANGVCGYDAKYYVLFMMTVHADDIVMFLDQFDTIDKCIMESYAVYPNKVKDHIYSDLETPRVIGRIESWAKLKKVELIRQPAHIKPTGYKWIGEKPLPKSDIMNHSLDGHVHFMYWAVLRGYIKLEDLIKRSANEPS